MRFHTVVELGGKTATGFQVPDEIVAALEQGRRPAVRVTVGGHGYASTVASMGGRFLVPLSAENRAAAGVAAGDESARAFFDGLAYTHRKEWVRWIEEAKRPEIRSTRVAKTAHALRAGRRTR